MSFGGSSTPLPKAEPVEPVPQEEDPQGVEAKRRARILAADREGFAHHRSISGGRSNSSAPSNQGARGETIQGRAKNSNRNRARITY